MGRRNKSGTLKRFCKNYWRGIKQPVPGNGRGHKNTDMEIIVKQNRETVKQKMADILLDVSWAKISEKYFGKSRSWLYHKMDGMNNGKPDDFNEEEKETLRNALVDLSRRINKCAESI